MTVDSLEFGTSLDSREFEAVPAVPPPAEPAQHQLSTAEIFERVAAKLQHADRYDDRRIDLGRRAISARLDAGELLSVAHDQRSDDRTWSSTLEEFGMPRTTDWELRRGWNECVKSGQTKEAFAAGFECWNELLVAYGIRKERQRRLVAPTAAASEDPESHRAEGFETVADEAVQVSTATALEEAERVAGPNEAEVAKPVPKREEADHQDEKAAQIVAEKPGAVEISEDEAIAFRQFIEAVGSLARAEEVFVEMTRRSAHG